MFRPGHPPRSPLLLDNESKLENKSNGRPSYNIEFVLEATVEDLKEEIDKEEEDGKIS